MLGSSFKHQGTWGLSCFSVTVSLSSSYFLRKKKKEVFALQLEFASWQHIYSVAINARTRILYEPGEKHNIESDH